MTLPGIIVSAQDYRRLCAMLDELPDSEATERLLDELERAEIRDPAEMPENVVTMRSRVTFSLPDSGKRFTYTLAYPADVNTETGQLSILTPVGTALLGLSVGQTIEWPTEAGNVVHVTIDEINYQPEKAGDNRL